MIEAEMTGIEKIDLGMTGEATIGRDVTDEEMIMTTGIEINLETTDTETEGTIENESEIIDEREVGVPPEVIEGDRVMLIETVDDYATTPASFWTENGPDDTSTIKGSEDDAVTPDPASSLSK
jgi:hypothetical protein